MSAEIVIQPLGEAQLDACAALVDGSPLLARYRFGGEQARRQLAAALQGEDGAEVELSAAVDQERRLLGFSWVLARGAFGRSAYLKLILVEPASAGRGVGRALIAELERRHLQRAGVVLLCAADNHPAQAFYRRLGYLQVGRLDGYVLPELDELVFYKRPPQT